MAGFVGNLDFLGHLPPASTYLLVEIDLSNSSPSASKEALNKFGKQIRQRQQLRKQKSDKEEKYFGKVDLISKKKFEDLKKQALGPGSLIGGKTKDSKPVIAYLMNE